MARLYTGFQRPGALDVRDWGARIDGASDDTGAWEEAVAEANTLGQVIYFPSGRSILKRGLVFTSNGTGIVGDGGWSSGFIFQPTVASTSAVKFSGAAATLLHCVLRHCGFQSPGGQDMAKQAVEIYNCRNFLLEGVRINPWTRNTASTNAIGLWIRGRDFIHVRDLYVNADLPVFLDENDKNSLTDLDSASFEKCYLQSTTSPNPVILIDPGYVWQRLVFRDQNWINGCLDLVDGSTVPKRTDKRTGFVVESMRCEQVDSPTVNTYAVKLDCHATAPSRMVRIAQAALAGDNSAPLASSHGLRVKSCDSLVIDQCDYFGTGDALDTNAASVDNRESPTVV